MPVETKYSDNREFVEILATGSVSAKEIIDNLRSIYADPEFVRLKYQLVDYTGVDDYDGGRADSNAIVSLDHRAAIKNPRMRIAIVATTDVIFGSARYWELSLGETPLETHVFRDREAANAWLFQPTK